MKLHLTFTILLVLLLTACKKEDDLEPVYNTGEDYLGCPSHIYISGYATDSLTGSPVEGIFVGPWPVVGPAYGISKADGEYTLPIYYNPCWKYAVLKPSGFTLTLKKEHTHYMNPDYVDLSSINEGDTAQRNIQVIPYSQLKVHITGDGTLLSIKDFSPSKNTIIALGNITDTIISRRIYSNRSISIQFFANGVLHTTIPYTSQYGSNETIHISYP